MRPGRGYPSGDTPASELPPPTATELTAEQIMATMASPNWRTRRLLDPVRAAALHEAVRHLGYHDHAKGEEGQQQVIECAERFEAWLAGPEETPHDDRR
jgi:hypothetical protein